MPAQFGDGHASISIRFLLTSSTSNVHVATHAVVGPFCGKDETSWNGHPHSCSMQLYVVDTKQSIEELVSTSWPHSTWLNCHVGAIGANFEWPEPLWSLQDALFLLKKKVLFFPLSGAIWMKRFNLRLQAVPSSNEWKQRVGGLGAMAKDNGWPLREDGDTVLGYTSYNIKISNSWTTFPTICEI